MRRWGPACVLLGSLANPAGADEVLAPGRYEVVIGIEIPHVQPLGMGRTAVICIRPDHTNGSHGLAVLGSNNPLASCPSTNLAWSGGGVSFEVICAGANAARGTATYQIAGDSFQGRILMTMGGKNMTMAETQTGRRLGPCAEPP